jgi:hypothetical protein
MAQGVRQLFANFVVNFVEGLCVKKIADTLVNGMAGLTTPREKTYHRAFAITDALSHAFAVYALAMQSLAQGCGLGFRQKRQYGLDRLRFFAALRA